jgi:hypothetical protein
MHQCWRSLTFWCGSGSADPYLILLDPEPDPIPDQTPFFSDFKDARKIFFSNFLSYNLPAGTLSSVLRIKFCYNFILQALFQSAQHLYEKKELMDPDPGGSTMCRSGSGSGSPTLICSKRTPCDPTSTFSYSLPRIFLAQRISAWFYHALLDQAKFDALYFFLFHHSV